MELNTVFTHTHTHRINERKRDKERESYQKMGLLVYIL